MQLTDGISVGEFITGGLNVVQLGVLCGIFFRLGNLSGRVKAVEEITESLGRRILFLEKPRRVIHER